MAHGRHVSCELYSFAWSSGSSCDIITIRWLSTSDKGNFSLIFFVKIILEKVIEMLTKTWHVCVCQENAMQLSHHLELREYENHDTRRKRNTSIVLGCLAEKLAGQNSTVLLNEEVMKYLITHLVWGSPHLSNFPSFQKCLIWDFTKRALSFFLGRGHESFRYPLHDNCPGKICSNQWEQDCDNEDSSVTRERKSTRQAGETCRLGQLRVSTSWLLCAVGIR